MTIHTTFPHAEVARREKTRAHFAWQQSAAERADLSPTVRLAAWALARRRNVLSGRCDPSYAGIAKGMGGVSERTAIRALAALERAGLIVVDRRVGRGRRNRITFIMPEKVTQACQGFAAGKGDKSSENKSSEKRPPDAALKGDKPGPEKVTELCHPNMKRASTKLSEHEEGENARAREASQSGARAPVGAAPEERTKPAADRPAAKAERRREGGRPTVRAKPRRVEGDYLALRQIWVRPWPDADDREAWQAYGAAAGEVGRRRNPGRREGLGEGHRSRALLAAFDAMVDCPRLGETAAWSRSAARREGDAGTESRGALHIPQT